MLSPSKSVGDNTSAKKEKVEILVQEMLIPVNAFICLCALFHTQKDGSGHNVKIEFPLMKYLQMWTFYIYAWTIQRFSPVFSIRPELISVAFGKVPVILAAHLMTTTLFIL